MTTSRRQTGFASLDPPQAWLPTRGRPQPQRLDVALDALPGVGVTLTRKLAKLGLGTVRDLLEHCPRRYESAADEVAIASLGRSTEEVVITGEVLNVSRIEHESALNEIDTNRRRFETNEHRITMLEREVAELKKLVQFLRPRH